eukprot:scaffold368566_cov16-Prasinocladus_malaysianus.AAC.1
MTKLLRSGNPCFNLLSYEYGTCSQCLSGNINCTNDGTRTRTYPHRGRTLALRTAIAGTYRYG